MYSSSNRLNSSEINRETLFKSDKFINLEYNVNRGSMNPLRKIMSVKEYGLGHACEDFPRREWVTPFIEFCKNPAQIKRRAVQFPPKDYRLIRRIVANLKNS